MFVSATPAPIFPAFPAAAAPAAQAAPPSAQGTADADSAKEREIRATVAKLEQREQEVIAHENAHRAAGGALVRGGGYEYVQGPDNRRYISGGDVQIDTSPVSGDPEATMAKAEQIIRAAMAPVEPSGQDLKVAAQARSMYNQASAEARMAQYRENTPEAQGQAGELLNLLA